MTRAAISETSSVDGFKKALSISRVWIDHVSTCNVRIQGPRQKMVSLAAASDVDVTTFREALRML